MKALKFLLPFFLLIALFDQAVAQKGKTQAVQKVNQLQNILKMNNERFAKFKTKLSMYTDSTTAVLKNKNLQMQDKQAAIDAIQGNRQKYLLAELSPEQYAAYKEFEISIGAMSAHKKLVDKQEKMQREKGMKVESKTSRTL